MGKVIGTLGKVLISPLTTIVGAIAGSKKTDPLPTAPEPKTAMPLVDDEAAKRARRNSTAAQMQRGGRQSTMLTGGTGDMLGS